MTLLDSDALALNSSEQEYQVPLCFWIPIVHSLILGTITSKVNWNNSDVHFNGDGSVDDNNLHGVVQELVLELLDVEDLLEEVVQLLLAHHLVFIFHEEGSDDDHHHDHHHHAHDHHHDVIGDHLVSQH